MEGSHVPASQPPLKRIIQVHDNIKYNYYIKSKQEQALEHQKRLERIMSHPKIVLQHNQNREKLLERESKLLNELEMIDLSQIKVKRDPTPTLPLRSLHLIKKNLIVAPEKVETRSTSALRRRTGGYSSRRNIRYSSAFRIASNKKYSNNGDSNDMNGLITTRKSAANLPTNNFKSAFDSHRSNIVEWLHALSIDFTSEESHRNSFHQEPTEKEILESMKNGAKLAEIVERLEGIEIRGIEKRPIRTAAILNNLNKVLEILRKRKNMNPRFLWSNREIMNGDEAVIWGLLHDMYLEYGRIFTVSKKKSSTTQLNASYDAITLSCVNKSVDAEQTKRQYVPRKASNKTNDKTSTKANVLQNHYHANVIAPPQAKYNKETLPTRKPHNDFDPYYSPPLRSRLLLE